MRRISHGRRSTLAALVLAATGSLSLQGCSTDKILSAEDPDLIVPNNLSGHILLGLTPRAKLQANV